MTRPANLKYTKSHEWVRVEGDEAVVGITDFAIDQLGDLAFVDLPEAGTQIDQGGPFGEIESTKTVSDLYAPVSGEIVAVNQEVQDNLDWISDGPFDKGWLIRIRVSQPAELENLLSAEQYAEQIVLEEEH